MISTQLGRQRQDGDMSMEPGGRADKLGNEYERLWVVRQMLRVLSGDVVSVTWEPAGRDSEGIDLLVELLDGSRSLESCKRENVGHGKWSLSHLHARSVLESAKLHLQSGCEKRFLFVSRDPCPEFRDLAERSRRYNHDFQVFYESLSKPLQRSFHQLGGHWGFSPESNADDRATTFELLVSCDSTAYDLTPLSDNVELNARRLVNADHDVTRSTLADFAIENLGNRLDRPLIVQHLVAKGLSITDAVDSQSVVRAISRLKESFKDSIRPHLIRNQLIEREESSTLIDVVLSNEPDRPRLLMVHGPAGTGKSGVLFELVKKLQDKSVPFLPLRLDRRTPTGSPEHFGREECGLQMSPAFALKESAGSERSVLILDQIDALRWTAAHSDRPMDVLTSLIREAVDPLLDSDITVVLVCRTFDMEDDARIAGLKNLTTSKSIQVGLLSDETVRDIVDSDRGIWASLTDRQKRLLQHPQTLYLWSTIQMSDDAILSFRTNTDLMRAYWHDLYQRRRSEAVDEDKLREVVDQFVEHINRSGRLTVPASIVDPSRATIVDFLQSSNVIRIDDRRQCVFSHQSYVDYLVAASLNRQLLSGDQTLTDWIKSTNQSLFRREQIRQVLSLQRDDDQAAYINAVEELLQDENVRFHLKHLAIRFLAQVDPPITSEIDLVVQLIGNADWTDHVYTQIIWNHPAWFKALDDRGLWIQWLESNDDEQIARALRLIGLMTKHFGPRITGLVTPLIERGGDWPDRISDYVGWGNLDEESDELFDLRLQLLQGGHKSIRNVWWEKLAKSDRKRAIQLFAVYANLFASTSERMRQGESDGSSDVEIEIRGRDDTKWLRMAAAKRPNHTWRDIAPICIRLEMIHRWAKRHRDQVVFQYSAFRFKDQCRKLLRKCEQLLTSASRSLAKRRPESFKPFVRYWSKQRRTRLIERCLLKAMSSLPSSDADFAAKWIMSKPRRFRLGDEYGQDYPEEPTWRVLTKLSNHCSDNVLMQLERAILGYRDPDLKRVLKLEHEHRSHLYANQHGRARYVLLSALPIDRLTGIARDQLGVWSRKYGRPRVGKGVHSYGGRVTSTIPSDRIHFLTDASWLYLASGEWSKRSGQGIRRKMMGSNLVGHASHEQFASDMGLMARKQPSRFAQLALRLPDSAPNNYLRAVLSAFDQKDPPDELVGEEGNSDSVSACNAWSPASADEIEAVFAKTGFPTDSETAKAICWLIDKRDDIKWTDLTIDLIDTLAKTHSDPAPDEFAAGTYDEEDRNKIIPHVGNSGLNCARGTAASAIKDLLFANLNLYERFRKAIESLTQDENVAVRAASVATCVPILNIDRDKAVEHFLAACSTDDDRVFEGHYINSFLSYTILPHQDRLAPVVERMANSSVDDVAERGASWATVLWLHTGGSHELVQLCSRGSKFQRMGVAETVGRTNWSKETVDRRIQLLPHFFDDEDKDVRAKASGLFWNDEAWADDRVAELAQQFISSRAFAEDPTTIVHGLAEAKCSILNRKEVVFAVADAFADPLADAAKDLSTGVAADVSDVYKLLLRLYQQAQDDDVRDIQSNCLDRWDALLAAGVSGYQSSESLLEATEK